MQKFLHTTHASVKMFLMVVGSTIAELLHIAFAGKGQQVTLYVPEHRGGDLCACVQVYWAAENTIYCTM